MKLRALSLNQVRRFTSAIEIKDIGDGLSVLSEPNEYGKSTIFDALHAVFFKAHGSKDKDMQALRPHAGGAPEIAVEVETDAGRFTIAKRWFQKPQATVHQDGRLIAQSDAAEDWIARLLGQGGGGPAGLIWVRQGMTALTDGSKNEKAAALEARRDLMSSVSDEVEAMTGGRRMDAALRRCEAELATYATGTGKPLKNGPWKAAQERVAALTERRAALEQVTQELHAALKDRNGKRRSLAELTDPDAVEARRTRLAQAQTALAEARRHAEEVDTLAQKADMARLTASTALSRLEDMRKALTEHEASTAQRAAAANAASAARDAFEAATTAEATARAALDAAARRLETAEVERRLAERAQTARDSAERRRDLETRIAEADAARQAMETAKAQVQGLSDADLASLEALAADLAAARIARDAGATRISVAYTGAGRVRLDGAELAEATALPLTRAVTLDLDGIGRLTVAPPEAAGGDPVEPAQRALQARLESLGLASIAEARQAVATRKAAEQTFGEKRAVFRSLAPQGLDPLRAQLARLPKPEDSPEAPDLAEATQAHDAAREAEKAARLAHGTAQERLSTARAERTGAETLLTQMQDRLTRATEALARFDRDEAALAQEAETARQSFQLAEAALKAKRESAPDLAAAEAAFRRATSVEEAASAEIDLLRPALARLEERISRAAGDAVEERLAETVEALTVAEADLARIEHEVAVLTRLQVALTSARSEARERYFEPVARELRPLLGLLWPEAELTWGEAELLPQGLVRNGIEEPLDILSGGTQEQIALLVRLAFARMLADAGRSAPVILDDALVFTDDDRIERMFDALHRQAGDLQIIVLTCRQRAFRNLGGQVLRLTEGAE
ncbi:AAA family ATPase [Tropicibacter sp. S64]|uniref:AAA family ATPase n=1 Tax=Tropicibacter sp. S64 TaxID=3415122 RepID=UPI003C7AB56F